MPREWRDRWTRLSIASAVPVACGKLLLRFLGDCDQRLFAELAAVVVGARKNAVPVGALLDDWRSKLIPNAAARADGLGARL